MKRIVVLLALITVMWEEVHYIDEVCGRVGCAVEHGSRRVTWGVRTKTFDTVEDALTYFYVAGNDKKFGGPCIESIKVREGE